jgi:hypothetical protein
MDFEKRNPPTMGTATGIELPPVPGEKGEKIKGQARRLSDATRERVFRFGDEKKSFLGEQAGMLAEKLESAVPTNGGTPALEEKFAGKAAGGLRRLQRALDTHSSEELIDMLEDRVRQRPAAFLAGALALGFFGARLIRR